MRVAFDLDNTLIRCGYEFPLEQPKRRVWARLLGGELLRQGIIELADYCSRHNWEVWVYTTSFRSSWYIRKIFWLHGIHLRGVINQARHKQQVTLSCTKHPPSFGIDLLIDDSEGVRIEAERHSFSMLVVHPEDKAWVQKVITGLAACQ
jgi:hypothetical protein